jgi:hypothetical protein
MAGPVKEDALSVDDVVIQIAPAPTEAERRAILDALAREVRAGETREPGAWWAAGLPDRADRES